MGKKRTILINIAGIVQGVGFRPFIYNLAKSININGYVRNNSEGVEITAQARPEILDQFIYEIKHSLPSQAVIDELKITEMINTQDYKEFKIQESSKSTTKNTRISPDLCLCTDCLGEMLDPSNRRFFYPYINCTNCGPRYTIVKDVPYDRKNTTMNSFGMCKKCQSEYDDPGNRRFHAQPNACYNCGPQIGLYSNTNKQILSGIDQSTTKELIIKAAKVLKEGNIIAIKGIGGFHFTCDAGNEDAVKRLRLKKNREQRPFAIMIKDIAALKKICIVTFEEENRILTKDRPIVLIKKNQSYSIGEAVACIGESVAYIGESVACIAEAVTPKNNYYGVMLPYAPLHFLLFEFIDFPLVMTSGNLSEEPIAHTNYDALVRLSELCDYFILGNRDINIRCDDSVTRLWQGTEYILRRSRGIAPDPVIYKAGFEKQIIAVGAEQKNTICLAKNNKAYLSHHIGDLKNAETYASFVQAIIHLQNILDIHPQAIAYDIHPQYLSTSCVQNPPEELDQLRGLPLIGVQHHHAHIASCMAENNLNETVIGIALDGTGFGTDNTIWGGEFLLADLSQSKKAGGLSPFLLPGGDKVIKQPWRTSISLLYQVYGDITINLLPDIFSDLTLDELKVVIFQVENQKQSIISSSCGRLFDAVSVLSGLCLTASYEGQPAIELEQVINMDSDNTDTDDVYNFGVSKKQEQYFLCWQSVIKQIVEDRKNNISAGIISYRFHTGLASGLARLCSHLSEETGIKKVVLSGGCFMNMVLLSALYKDLINRGFKVFTHSLVPCNDGGIALGQVVVANQKLKEM